MYVNVVEPGGQLVQLSVSWWRYSPGGHETQFRGSKESSSGKNPPSAAASPLAAAWRYVSYRRVVEDHLTEPPGADSAVVAAPFEGVIPAAAAAASTSRGGGGGQSKSRSGRLLTIR